MVKYNPNIHHRKSIRLKGYDYSQAGLYFVTLCTQNRECLFGNITDAKMILNDAGKMVEKCWNEIPNHFPNTRLHPMVVMPNHFHGILEITVGAKNHSPVVGAKNISPNKTNNHSPNNMNNHSPDNTNNMAKNISPPQSPSKTIGSVVRGFKIGVTKWFREKYPNHFPVGQSVWQRNYWEHIIQNENEYHRIAQYIINNPVKWYNDKLNNGDGNIVLEPQIKYGNEPWMI